MSTSTTNYLLSVGTEAKVWRAATLSSDSLKKVPEYTCISSVEPQSHSEPVHGIWGTSSAYPVFALTFKDKITIHDVQGNHLDTVQAGIDLSKSDELVACQFLNSDRNLVFTGTHKIVKVYDRVNKLVSESYEPTSHRITSLAVSHDDSNLWIAVGTVAGEIVVIHRKHKERVQLRTPFTKSVTCLAFSSQSTSLLIAGSADGHVAYWNVEDSMDPCAHFQSHSDTVTCLAPSPVNRLAFFSCGLDGKLILYGISDARIVKHFSFPYAFTSMAYKKDDMTLALGSNQGEIGLIYLKKPTEFVHFLKGQTSTHPIRSLWFQNALDRRGSLLSSNKFKKTPMALDTTSLNTSPFVSNLTTTTPNKPMSSITSNDPVSNLKSTEFLSPFPSTPNPTFSATVVNATPSQPSSRDNHTHTIPSSVSSTTSSTSTTSSSISSGTSFLFQKEHPHLDVFSPVKASPSPMFVTNPTLKPNSKLNSTSAYVSPPSQPPTSTSPSSPLNFTLSRPLQNPPSSLTSPRRHTFFTTHPSLANGHNNTMNPTHHTDPSPIGLQQLVHSSSSSFSSSSSSTSPPYAKFAITRTSLSSTSPTSPTLPSSPSASSQQRPQVQQEKQPPFLSSSHSTSSHSSSSSSTSSSLPSTMMDPRQFSETVLSNTLNDLFMEYTSVLRTDLQNLHLELLRQFEFQRLEFESLFQHQTNALRDLISENEKLKKEINRFKGYYS